MSDDLIPPDDLCVEYYDPRPLGGQHVGISSSIKVEHLPTGTIVIIQAMRSMHKTRIVAVRAILSVLTDPDFRA